MATEKKYKKDKEIILEVDNQAKDLRAQVLEQNRCLDVRLEAQLGMISELQDYFRRRAEVELEYGRNLDKLTKAINVRNKQERVKREVWPHYSTYNVWQALLRACKRQSLDHMTLSDIYSQQMTSRLQDTMDDMQRVHKKCKEIGSENHEELVKVLNELQSAMRTYQQYHNDSLIAESKFRNAEALKIKAEQAAKGTLSRRVRNLEKATEKKQKKYQESKQKALMARNEYLLTLQAANAGIHHYFCEDIHNIINCIDCGLHNSLERALKMHVSGEENLIKSRQDSVRDMRAATETLDQGADKQYFLELYNAAFALPKKFEFQPHKDDPVRQISAQKVVQPEMVERLQTLEENINKYKVELDEAWKTIKTVEKSFIELINQKDFDVSPLFTDEPKTPRSPHEKFKKRSDRMDTEEFYIKKFRDCTIQGSRMSRMEAKQKALQKALGEGGDTGSLTRPPSVPPKPRSSRRLGKIPKEGSPKLFGGSIEEYVDATGQEIPLVVRSCVRAINLYGRYHQGVFRVSGSKPEIDKNKSAFEKGDDPLLDIVRAKDVNSVAGCLKLYFRELQDPLVPTHLFDALINCSKINDPKEKMARVRELLGELAKAKFVVARYLFAFLSHLSEFSDENLMDAFNLGICFGPTLVPIPPDRDQELYHSYVNDLVKLIIMNHEFIFPRDIEGELYEKIVIEEQEDGEGCDAIDNLSDEEVDETVDSISDEGSVSNLSKRSQPETEPEASSVAPTAAPSLEAVAQYDFSGRTHRELSFRKGDVLQVFEQVSVDWWRGACQGRAGLVPAKYIKVNRPGPMHSRSSSDLLRRPAKDSTSSAPGGNDVISAAKSEKRRSIDPLASRSLGLSDSTVSASQPNVCLSSPENQSPRSPQSPEQHPVSLQHQISSPGQIQTSTTPTAPSVSVVNTTTKAPNTVPPQSSALSPASSNDTDSSSSSIVSVVARAMSPVSEPSKGTNTQAILQTPLQRPGNPDQVRQATTRRLYTTPATETGSELQDADLSGFVPAESDEDEMQTGNQLTFGKTTQFQTNLGRFNVASRASGIVGADPKKKRSGSFQVRDVQARPRIVARSKSPPGTSSQNEKPQRSRTPPPITPRSSSKSRDNSLESARDATNKPTPRTGTTTAPDSSGISSPLPLPPPSPLHTVSDTDTPRNATRYDSVTSAPAVILKDATMSVSMTDYLPSAAPRGEFASSRGKVSARGYASEEDEEVEDVDDHVSTFRHHAARPATTDEQESISSSPVSSIATSRSRETRQSKDSGLSQSRETMPGSEEPVRGIAAHQHRESPDPGDDSSLETASNSIGGSKTETQPISFYQTAKSFDKSPAASNVNTAKSESSQNHFQNKTVLVSNGSHQLSGASLGQSGRGEVAPPDEKGGDGDWNTVNVTLQQMMHEVHSLEEHRYETQPLTVLTTQQALFKHQPVPVKSTVPGVGGVDGGKGMTLTLTSGAGDTPDLVMGLPVGQSASSPESTAEVFVAHGNQSTIKKGSVSSSHSVPQTPSLSAEHPNKRMGSQTAPLPLETSMSADSVPKVLEYSRTATGSAGQQSRLGPSNQGAGKASPESCPGYPLEHQPDAEESLLMRRTASTTTALRARKSPEHKGYRPGLLRHLSVHDESGTSFVQSAMSVEQKKTAQWTSPAPVAGVVRGHPGVPTGTPLHQSQSPTQVSSDPSRGEKPPIKTKPSIMKKPDLTKRFKDGVTEIGQTSPGNP